MIFLTFNDKPSGIFTSQVIDVVKLLNEKEKITLVSFVSWRIYKESKKQIKSSYPNSKVFPIIAGISRWKMNFFLLKLIAKNQTCIARGPLACELALNRGFKKVCYDGRAAVSAEIDEFQVVEGEKLINEFKKAERVAVLNSDYRIAVSETLIKYWQERFNYKEENHIIIPCTLANVFIGDSSNEKKDLLKKKLQLASNDVVFCFSGGNAGWNSLERTFLIFRPILKENPNYKLLLLTGDSDYIEKFQKEFPNQALRYWVNHDEVQDYLSIADYGLLIREDKITNNVASPVKFAEYISMGLNVIISDNIKDYASFVETHKCGFVVRENMNLSFSKLSLDDRKGNMELAEEQLSKTSTKIIEKYNLLMEKILRE